MGKIRKAKPNRNRNVATAAESEDEEQIPSDSKENALQIILDQLQAANVEEKYCGLQTMAMLIENPETVDQVINRGLVKVAAPLLLDPASSVRNAAAGTLRNLSAVKLEVCDALMEQDIMTPVTCYYHEHAAEWTLDSSSKKTKDEDVDTYIQCTNLLLNLCESSELAIKYVSQSKILDILPRYLHLSSFGSEIVTTTLQCLLVIVEDNQFAMEKIKSNSEKQLEDLISLEGNEPSALLIKTLAAGVIINTCSGNISVLPTNVISGVMNIQARTLSVDHKLACNQLSSNVPLSDSTGKVKAPKGNDAKTLDNQIKAVSNMLDAQQSAIEIVANICSCDDGEEVNDDSSDSEIDDEICDNGEETMLSEDKLSPEVLEALVSLEIFEKVWARTQLPPQNVLMILKEYEGSNFVYKKILNVQSRALLCINNMLSTLPIDSLGGVNGVYKIWVEAGKLVFQEKAENFSLLESATAVMRASLDKIKIRENGNVNECNLFSEMALSDIQMMLTGIKDCQMPEIRSNLIRMIGILALLLVNNLNELTSNVICTITEFILDQAHKENEVWVLAEAIDSLVDLYSEDETDGLAAKVKLIEKLSILGPIFKNKIRQQKRLPKEYKVLVSTASSNLPRFIKYKKNRLSKM